MLCSSSGCSVYSEYSLFNLSFYIYGGLGFLVLAVAILLSDKFQCLKKVTATFLASALVVDSLLLCYQIFYWRCSSCFIVACLLGACAILYISSSTVECPKLLKCSFVIWILAFIPVGVLLAKDLTSSPWVIYGPENASVKLYFSPTCLTCEKTIKEIFSHVENDTSIALIPIAKNEEDQKRLAHYLEQKRSGNDDIDLLFSGDTHACSLEGKDRFCVEKNKMLLSNMGYKTVPIVIASGSLPTVTVQKKQYETDMESLFSK